MSAGTIVNLVVNQKASFQIVVYVKDDGVAQNLTGYTTAAKYKDNYQTPDTQAKTFTTSVTDAANGEITMSLTPEQTTQLQIQKYVYDLAIISSTGFKTRVMEGMITVSGGVS
jgi:hypothetical protein